MKMLLSFEGRKTPSSGYQCTLKWMRYLSGLGCSIIWGETFLIQEICFYVCCIGLFLLLKQVSN